MPIEWTAADLDDLVAQYRSGVSIKALSERLGISRPVITRALDDAGVERRSRTEANRLLAAGRSDEEKAALAAHAHRGRRGNTDPWERKVQRAQTRQERLIGVSPAELLLAEWLTQRGVESIPQQAVGAYNVDLGAAPVAVEVFGGSWHGTGTHWRRAPERFRYILDQGWLVLVVWVDAQRWPLSPVVADHVVALRELASRDPSLRGQYRVVWGDGQISSAGGSDVDQVSDKPARATAVDGWT